MSYIVENVLQVAGSHTFYGIGIECDFELSLFLGKLHGGKWDMRVLFTVHRSGGYIQ